MVTAVCAQRRFALLAFGGALAILQVSVQPFKVDLWQHPNAYSTHFADEEVNAYVGSLLCFIFHSL